MTIVAHQNRRQDIYIELKEGRRALRKLHSHEGHYNPGGILVPRAHMHFPSRRYPLLPDGSSYAYPVEAEMETAADGVLYFCDLLGISIDGIQYFLG